MPGALHKPDLPEWLVSAKVQPPRTGNTELFRLATSLENDQFFVTYMEAPAGYGKTTLLNQHRQRWLEGADAKAVWLTFSRGETSRSFVEYLAFALIKKDVDLPIDFFEGLAENATLNKHLNILVNAIEYDDANWLLIFDDLEVIGDDICETVDYLIDVAPSNVKFLIAGRKNPGLALSRYAAQAQLLQLRAEELTFSAQHILALIGEDISLAQAKRIQQATLGWPIAVQLVNMDIKTGCTLDEALRRLGDGSETASHYIKEQIDSRLPERLRTMLLEASVLDWLEVDALNATQGSDNLLAYLNDFGEIGSLISPIGEDTDIYRIHPLLRDFLQETLKREGVEKYRALHRSAAMWMGSQNRLRLALSHASESEDQSLVGALIEKFGAVRLFIQEGVARAFSSQDYLTDEILVAFPRVALMYSVIQTKRGILVDARHVYLKVAKITNGYKKDRSGGDDAALELEHRFCLPFLVLYGCLPSELLKQSDLDEMPAGMGDSALVDGAYNNTLCVSNFVRGHFGEASLRATYARRSYREASSVYGELYIDLHEGAIAFNSGELGRAVKIYEHAKIKQRKLFREDEGARLACDVLLAELYLFQGEFGRADKITPSLAKRLIAYEAWRDIYAVAVTSAVDYYLALNQLDEASRFLEDIRLYMEQQELSDILPTLACLDFVVRAAQGERRMSTPELPEGLPDKDSLLASLLNTPWRDIENLTKTHYRLQQSMGRAAGLGGLAHRVADAFFKKGVNAPACRVLVVAACSEWVVGHKEQAIALIKQALVPIKKNGGIGPLKLQADIVSQIVEGAGEGALDETQIVWLKDILAVQPAPAEKPMFSPRETDVLIHLMKGKQDKVIARELDVTEHAVRYHLKNIYARLEVSGRHEAAAYIRKMKLLQK